MNYIERCLDRGFGQPVISGTRLTVFNVITGAYYAENIEVFLKEFALNFSQLQSAVTYCKELKCKDIKSIGEHYCDGCILRSISEGWNSINDEFIENDSISISKDKKTFSLGTIEDLENAEFGITGWLLAEKVEQRLNNDYTSN